MSDARDGETSTNPTPTSADVPLTSSESVSSSPLVRFGGLLGIAGTAIGFIVLIAGCAGATKAMTLGAVVVGFGALGLLVTLVGAFTQHRRIGEDTHVLQALFASLIAVIGGVLEMAVHLRWPIIK